MKLKAESFIYTAPDGKVFNYKADVSIDASGVFSFSIMPEFVPCFDDVKASNPSFAKVAYTTDRKKHIPIITSTDKSTGLIFMEKLIKAYCACEAVEEYVIRYHFMNNTLAVKDAANRIYSNGTYATTTTRIGNPTTHAYNPINYYYTGLYAGLFLKQTYKRETGDTVKYIHITTSCRGQVEGKDQVIFAPDTYASKLASFICLSPHNDTSNFKEVPYTENAAKFFYNLLISICRLGDKIDNFVKNPSHTEYITAEQPDDTSISLESLMDYVDCVHLAKKNTTCKAHDVIIGYMEGSPEKEREIITTLKCSLCKFMDCPDRMK